MMRSRSQTTIPARASSLRAGEAGYTLVELLVATMLSTMILGGMYTALFQAQVAFEEQLEAMAARQQARVAVDKVVPEIRMAGFRLGNLTEAIEEAAPTWITFVGDIDNGSAGPPCDAAVENAPNGGAERVTYAVSGSDMVRVVECWSGTAWTDGVKEIVASDLVNGGVAFRYFDGAGSELSPGANGLSATQRARVRSLTFTVAVAEASAKKVIVVQKDDAGKEDKVILVQDNKDVHVVAGSASLRNVR